MMKRLVIVFTIILLCITTVFIINIERMSTIKNSIDNIEEPVNNLKTTESIDNKRELYKPLKLDKIPEKIALLAFKFERKMELWGLENNKWEYIKSYEILGASGYLGPKLKEGDKQVPEGVYKIIGMNSKSKYYYAMLINYPNSFDKEMAKEENRENLGGDICIHGTNKSIGCIAIGDYSKELFELVKQIKVSNTKVIIAPYDFRQSEKQVVNSDIKWLPELYKLINKELENFKR